VLDDLHWADPSSLDLLSFAVGQLHAARILVVVAFRDDELAEAPSPQRDLLSRGVHVPLRGLGVGGIVDLVAADVEHLVVRFDGSGLLERSR
jgi:hypothetical protein